MNEARYETMLESLTPEEFAAVLMLGGTSDDSGSPAGIYRSCLGSFGLTHARSLEVARSIPWRMGFPGIKGTDSVFMEGRKLDGQQFEDAPADVGARYLSLAKTAGVSTTGKYYSGTLARFPGDPRAWVSGLSDVRRIAQERNIGVTGAVNIEAPKYGDGYVPPEKYQVDERLVAERVAAIVAASDEPVKDVGELTANVAKQMAGVWG